MQFNIKATDAWALGIMWLSFGVASGQTGEQNMHQWFDSKTGTHNSSINNGPVYYNQYKTRDAVITPFLGLDEFVSGDVWYDGQPYYNVMIKYDIHNDALVLQPATGGNFTSIKLITEKTAAFKIHDRKFVNLEYGDAKVPESVDGFYEENFVGNGFILYVKHHKRAKEIIANQTLYTDYIADNEFLLYKKDNYHKIGSRSSIVKLFPELKDQINTFYSTTKNKSEIQFMENLFQYLNTILK